MALSVEARGLSLDYPLYTVRAQSLRHAVINAAVGGLLMKTKRDVTVVRALSNISFSLTEGDRLALVGHNGSGKTSLLKVLAGVYAPSSGNLQINGRVTSMISMSIGLDPDASGLRNINTLLLMQALSRREIADRVPKIVEFSELGPYIHMPFKTYSAGMMARLIFAVGTAVEADVLLMDEWLSAGDASFRDKAAARIEAFVGSAKLLVLGTHDYHLVDKVCNKVLMLDAGRPIFYGSVAEWKLRADVSV
jgi:lipopolysaccharide transport system ATP-binding protein